MPNRNTLPSLGKKCGRRERGADARKRGEVIPPQRSRETAEGTPVFRKTLPFAGRRRNEDLGRSVHPRGFLPADRRTGDNGCPKGAEEGNVVSERDQSARTHRKGHVSLAIGDASFTRSFDPCSSIATLLLRRKPFGGGALGMASRSGKPAQAGGTGTGAASSGRGAARLSSPLPQGRGVAGKKRKEVTASVPARIQSPGLVARTS